MPADDATADSGLRYDFQVTAGSTYARTARLIGSLERPGLVVDLGAGVGALGTAVATLGFDYLGLDHDPDNVQAIESRAMAAGPLDLRDGGFVDDVLARIERLAPDHVAAVTLLDVVEHLPEPEALLADVARLIQRIGERWAATPVLVLSIPNVAHVDLAAKLVTGRWDITEVGLLDSTHISLFTERRLRDVVAATGFGEVARDDVIRRADDQFFPPDHPGTGRTTLHRFVRHLLEADGSDAHAYQFVRAYRPAGTPTSVVDEGPADVPEGPFLSVVVRTQGHRSTLLDALTCLAAQDDDDLEVLLMVNNEDAEVVPPIEALVDRFDARFRERVHVHHVPGGGRSRPLNMALDAARGRYLAILDDDDIVTADWVGAFRRAVDRAPGAMARTACVVQAIERRDGGIADYEVTSGFVDAFPAEFDLVDAIRANRSPSCSYAVPLGTVDALGLRFDETLRVCEDWRFELEVARVAGVSSGPEVTSIYRRWNDGGGSDGDEDSAAWIEDHDRVVARLDASPTLLPPGSLTRIHRVYEYVEQLERELGRRADDDPPFRGP